MKTSVIINIIFGLVVGLLAWLLFQKPKEVIKYEFVTDTVTIRDTLITEIPIPEIIYIDRYDTITVTVQDSIEVEVPVPITRKKYETEDYRAVIEGFRPELIEMAVFPKTTIITNTETITKFKKSRWGVGVQVGYGLSLQKEPKFAPYIGVGVQYNILSW